MSGLTQKQLVIGLVVIAALLAAIIGIIVYQNGNTVPAVSTSATPVATDPAPTQGDPVPPAGGEEFDPATAPAVPEGETPEEYVNRYYQAAADKDYEGAYVMLPTATQAYYGDSAGFQSTLEGYGVSGFSVNPQAEADGRITVVGVQDAQGMQFPYTWTFAAGDNGSWLVMSREMGGQ